MAINTSLRVEREHPQGVLEVAVHRLPDGVFVTDDHCTHQPVSLAQGFIEDGIVYCPFHGGAFDARTGEPARRPCTEPLRTYALRVVDGRVLVDPEPRVTERRVTGACATVTAPAKPADRG